MSGAGYTIEDNELAPNFTCASFPATVQPRISLVCNVQVTLETGPEKEEYGSCLQLFLITVL